MLYQVNIPILDELLKESPANNFEVATDLGDYIGSIAGLMLSIAAIAMFIYFVWGGIKWLTAGAETQKVDEARTDWPGYCCLLLGHLPPR